MNDTPSEDLIIAIDSGGTKCDVVVLDYQGNLLGWEHDQVVGQGGRHYSAMYRTLRPALAALGERVRDARLLLAMAGAVRLPIDVFRGQNRHQFSVLHVPEWDAARALAGVRDGLVVLAGTGAVVSGRTREGRQQYLDGYGPIVGDFGSGFSIGMRAVRASVRADWHPRHATSLRDRVMAALGLSHGRELFSSNIFGQDRSLVASLASIVGEEAEKGDPIARGILRRSADELIDTYRDVVDNLGMTGGEYPVVGTGGVIARNDFYWRLLVERIERHTPGFTCIRRLEPPVAGVAFVALNAYAPDPEPARDRLHKQMQVQTRTLVAGASQ